MHILEEKIRMANSQGRSALIPFLTAGFPDRATFWPTLMELDENGADIIEIGVPFSDPVADGPVVEAASRQALSEGVNLRQILQELKERRQDRRQFFRGDSKPRASQNAPGRGTKSQKRDQYRKAPLSFFGLCQKQKARERYDGAVSCVRENHREEYAEEKQEPRRNVVLVVAGRYVQEVGQRINQADQLVVLKLCRNVVLVGRIVGSQGPMVFGGLGLERVHRVDGNVAGKPR